MILNELTTIGNCDRFGIMYALHPESTEHLRFGRVSFYAGGQQIGDLGELICLTDLLGELKYPIGDCGNRGSDRFCALTPEAAFRSLHAALFEGESSENDSANVEMWARFNVSIGVDVFRKWRLYLVDCIDHGY